MPACDKFPLPWWERVRVRGVLNDYEFMPPQIQMAIGHLLYQKCFPVYRLLYSLYKRFTDAKERQILKSYLKPGMTVLDIGSNIGLYALFLSRLVGEKGKVYCFEPSEENFTHLTKVTRRVKNIIVNKLAVGNVTGKLTLYLSDSLNVDHRTYPAGNTRNTTSVNSVRLDDCYLSNGKVDFIKIDIQGFEYEAFMGMKNILNNNPDIAVLSEFWPHGLKAAGREPEEFIALIKSYGFCIYLIDRQKGLTEFSIEKSTSDYVSERYFNIFCTKNTDLLKSKLKRY